MAEMPSIFQGLSHEELEQARQWLNERAEDEQWEAARVWLARRAEELDEEWANDNEYRPWED